MNSQPNLAEVASAPYLYLTTTGRVTKAPKTVELWFVYFEGKLYVIPGTASGRRPYWVGNIETDPRVSVRIKDLQMQGTARVLDASESALSETISRVACAKYNEPEPWGTPVEITIQLDGS